MCVFVLSCEFVCACVCAFTCVYVTGSGKSARNSLSLQTRYTRNNAKSLTSANFNLRHRWVGQHVGNVRTKFQSQPSRSSKVVEVCVTSVQ